MLGTVYVVGAGASRFDTKHLDLPLPLAKEFFAPQYLSRYWPGHGSDARNVPSFQKSSTAAVLKEYFGINYEAIDNEEFHINVEEVYSFLTSSVHRFRPRIYHQDVMELARREILTYIHQVIRYVPSYLKRTPKLHSSIVSWLCPEDSVITFNWDLLFDKALAQDELGASFLNRQDSLRNPQKHEDSLTGGVDLFHDDRGHFIKLHGSVNLMSCTNTSCYRHSSPYKLGLEEVEEYSPELFHCRACGSPLETAIMPPQGSKSYGAGRFFSLQAGLAAEEIHHASQIVVIGYSFPAFDFEARSLIRAARRQLDRVEDIAFNLERLVIVDPQTGEDEYCNRVKELFGLDWARSLRGPETIEFLTYSSVESFLAHSQ